MGEEKSPLSLIALLLLLGLPACDRPIKEQASVTQTSAPQEESVVRDLQLIDADHGWVLTDHALNFTEDGGDSWRDNTPPVKPDSITDVYFLDANTGWALTSPDVADTSAQWVLFATHDSGATWVPFPFPNPGPVGGRGAPVEIDFTRRDSGWAIVKQPSSAQFSMGRLFRTKDGGVTWTELEIPVGGRINFIDDSTGWLAGGAKGDQLYVTNDGGTVWTRVIVPVPPAFRQGTTTFGVPIFPSGDLGVLPVTFAGPVEPSGFAFYRSQDGGRSWKLPGPVVPSQRPFATGVSVLADAEVPDAWFGLNPQDLSHLAVARERGSRVDQIDSNGLPDAVDLLDFANGSTGWAASKIERCPGKTNCVQESSLVRTDDAGRNWQPLPLP